MKLGKKTLTVIAALAVLLSAAMMTSCANETPTEDPSSSATVNQTPGQTTAGPTQPQPTEPPVEDEDVVLNFGDGLVATAEVKKSREIELRAQSNYVLIKGTGKFTVKIGEAEPVASDDKFEVKLENTADVYNSMVMTIQVEAAQTLEFTLIHNPGTEGNPYEVAASGETKVDFKEGVFVKIVDSGWYTLTGNEFYLTNYTTKENPVNEYKAYLAAGVYGISVKDKNADSSVTLTRVAAPAGYSEGQPLDVTELGDAKLTLFSGTKLYFRFTAPAEGLYVFSTGSEGKGSNCRFSVSTDDYATYYGRYYENEQWLTCAGGKNYAVHMVEDGQITIVVDYTMGEKLVGSDEVSINISNPVKIEALDQAVSATLEQKGKAYYAFTAEEKGLYSFNLGLGNVNKQSRFQVWRKVQSEGRDDAVTYEWVKGEYYTGSAQARLEAGESVYIVVDSEKGAYGSVSVQVERSLEEPLPETGWVSGTYEGTVTIVLDRESKTVKYGNFDPVRFYYLDGKATFTVELGGETTTYTMSMNENGTDIDLTSLRSSGEEETVTFVYAVPVDPVAIEKWQGIYQDADGNKLSIFSDGSGVIGMNRYFVGSNGTKYDAKKNILNWSGDYTITIESMNDSGRVASISVKPRGGDTVVYTLESETVVVPPQYLPVEDGQKYTGANKYTLIGLNNLNSADIVVLAKNDDGSYTIAGLNVEYDRIVMKVVIEKDGDAVVSIKIYDEKGNLLDTLTKPGKVTTPDIKVDGTKQDQSKSDEGFDGMYYVKITATGWYTFYGEEGVQIIPASESADGKMVPDWTNKYNLSTSGVTKEYQEGDIIAFYNGNFTASYSATKPESNEEGTETNPFEWDGSILNVDDHLQGTDRFYITFTAPSAGTYNLKFIHLENDSEQFNVFYNGAQYGRWHDDDAKKWNEYDGRLPVVMELTEGQQITFSVARGYSRAKDWMMKLEAVGGGSEGGGSEGGDVTPPAGDVSFTADQQGTYTGNIGGEQYTFTVKKDTIDIADDYGDGVDTAEDVIMAFDGEWYTADVTVGYLEWDLKFKFVDGQICFTIDGFDYFYLSKKDESSDESSSVYGKYECVDEESALIGTVLDFKQDGTMDFVNSDWGWNEIGINYEMVDGWYTFTYQEPDMSTGEPVTQEGKFKIVDGKLILVVEYSGEEEHTLEKQGGGASSGSNLFEKEDEGAYVYEGAEGELYYLTINADGTVSYMDHLENMVQNAVVELSRDMMWYQFECGDMTISFRFSNEAGTIITLVVEDKSVELTKSAGEDGEGGEGGSDAPSVDDVVGSWSGSGIFDSEKISFSLVIRADGTLDYNCDGMSFKNCNWELKGNELTFTYKNGGDYTVVCTITDGEMSIVDDIYTGVLTKQDGSDSGETGGMFSAKQQGVWTDAEMSHTLFIGANSIIYMDADGNEYEPTDLTQTLDGGSYRFTLEDGTNVIFRFLEEDDGTITGISMAVGGTPVELEPYTP